MAPAQTKAKKCSPRSSGAGQGRFRQDRCGSELPFLERLVDAGERSRHMVLTDGEGLISFVCAVSKNVTECSRDRILALYARVPPAHVDAGGAEIAYDEFVHLLRGTIVSYELELPRPWGTRRTWKHPLGKAAGILLLDNIGRRQTPETRKSAHRLSHVIARELLHCVKCGLAQRSKAFPARPSPILVPSSFAVASLLALCHPP